MASLAKIFLLSLIISFSLVHAQTPSKSSSKPKALILPITKDHNTLQYLTHLNLGTPPVAKNFVVDLGGQHLWIDCDTGYHSSSYKPGRCGTASCSLARAFCVSICPNPPRPGCNNNTCKVLASNTIFGGRIVTEVSLDTISLQSTDGSKAGSPVSVSDFIFGCANSWDLINLANGANGMIGLGKGRVAFPSQLSSSFGGSLRRKFAICLPSTPKHNGVLFFGDSPYHFYPSYNTSKVIDLSSRFMYNKLHTAYERTLPRFQGEQVPEYFVRVTSILVNNKPIPINTTLLEFHRSGIGGTRIATVKPYTILESSIYNSLVKVFDEEIAAHKVKKIAAVAPFKDCYTKGNLAMTRLGLDVPDIIFVLENKEEGWYIHGANSMVEISNDVVCLGFLSHESDQFTTTSIDIGAHQLQNYLLQFDLAASRMGITSSLLLQEVECSNFKL